MAEQSSTVATFRAPVMLLCVILIPVAAICGTSFPNVVKAIQSGRFPTLADFRTANSPANSRSEAPPFSGLPPTLAMQPVARPTALAPGYGTAPDAARSPVVQLSYNAPVATGTQSTSFPQGAAARYDENSVASQNHEPEKLLPLEHSAGSASPLATLPGAQGGPMTPDTQFMHGLDRLRQMGATYYLLEAWGDQKQQYRFYCRMSIGGDPHVVQPFQYIDSNPLQAMTKVLEQVEAWEKRGS